MSPSVENPEHGARLSAEEARLVLSGQKPYADTKPSTELAMVRRLEQLTQEEAVADKPGVSAKEQLEILRAEELARISKEDSEVPVSAKAAQAEELVQDALTYPTTIDQALAAAAVLAKLAELEILQQISDRLRRLS